MINSQIGCLVSVVVLRIFGLFMLLPIFSIEAIQYAHASHLKVGMAMSIYGLMQAICLFPMGMLSDKYGRRVVILFGLCLFILGSLLGYLATDIHMLILARALQGCGAISGVVIAALMDVAGEGKRNQVMALLGIMIALSFYTSIICGPLLVNILHLKGLFAITGFLGLVALALLYPMQLSHQGHDTNTLTQLRELLSSLRGVHFGLLLIAFIQHGILASLFFVLPFVFSQSLDLSASQSAYVYLFSIVLSLGFALPLLRRLDSHPHQKGPIFVFGMLSIMLGQILCCLGMGHLLSLGLSLWVFFIGFNLFEAAIPATLSGLAPTHMRGAMMGIYTSAQYLGISLGAIFAAYAYHYFGVDGVLMLTVLLSILLVLPMVVWRRRPIQVDLG